MKKLASLLATVLAFVAMSSGTAFAHDIKVKLNMMNNSGMTGTVTLTSMSDTTTKVVIEMTPASAEAQPVHIHHGSCGAGLGDHFYDLNDIVNGKSETIVPHDVHDLTKGDLSINVHKSHTEVSVHVACGIIVSTSHHEDANPGMPMTGAGDMVLPLLAALAGAVLLSMGATLRRGTHL